MSNFEFSIRNNNINSEFQYANLLFQITTLFLQDMNIFNMFICYFKLIKKSQRSGIDIIKYHTWPKTPYGKTTKTQENTKEVVSPLPQVTPSKLLICFFKISRHQYEIPKQM